VLFVVEDNAWGISVSKHDSTAVPRNDVRAAAYGIPELSFRTTIRLRSSMSQAKRSSAPVMVAARR